jgi:hypothetical protein
MGAVAAFIIFGGPATLLGPARAGDIVASNGGAAGIMGFRIAVNQASNTFGCGVPFLKHSMPIPKQGFRWLPGCQA